MERLDFLMNLLYTFISPSLLTFNRPFLKCLLVGKKKSQRVVGMGGAGEQEIRYKLPHEQCEELPKIFVVFRITYQK